MFECLLHTRHKKGKINAGSLVLRSSEQEQELVKDASISSCHVCREECNRKYKRNSMAAVNASKKEEVTLARQQQPTPVRSQNLNQVSFCKIDMGRSWQKELSLRTNWSSRIFSSLDTTFSRSHTG